MTKPIVYRFAVASLAVWRITHLVHAEDGPAEIVVRLRKAAGTSFVGQAMDCFYCASLWTSAPVAYAIGDGWIERVVLWPALSAGAIFLEQLVVRERDE